MWVDKLVDGLSGPQIINDSKTPSGRVHVGSLRGVLIHDAILRALKERDIPAHFLYGVDDYDPMDGLPDNADPELREHMGKPLCMVPVKDGDKTIPLAEFYISEFLDLFRLLGVEAKIYHTGAMYRNGDFDNAIAVLLDQADIVREIYATVSGSQKTADWHPFQVICENCGKIGTTRVTAWDGNKVTYCCEPELVRWARGCGYRGDISPFGGNGKLPWKLEWVAKWHTSGVTIEGAGKDHCTKGGSRDIANTVARRLFKQSPPLNIPYEFFLVDGAKMSSSGGIGATARDMADFLPPDILRFLMLRSMPQKTVNFSTRADYIARLFNEYDDAILHRSKADNDTLLRLVSVTKEPPSSAPASFQLLTAILQLPHINAEDELVRRAGQSLSETDKHLLRERIAAVRYWLEHFADDEDKLTLCDTLPESAATLSAAQKAFLHLLAEHLPPDDADEEANQRCLYDVARATPLPAKEAFLAIYRVLFDRSHGPKGGGILAYLSRADLIKRFTAVSRDIGVWWRDTALPVDEIVVWLQQNGDPSRPVPCKIVNASDTSLYVLELLITARDGKTHGRRTLLQSTKDTDCRNEARAACDKISALSVPEANAFRCVLSEEITRV